MLKYINIWIYFFFLLYLSTPLFPVKNVVLWPELELGTPLNSPWKGHWVGSHLFMCYSSLPSSTYIQHRIPAFKDYNVCQWVQHVCWSCLRPLIRPETSEHTTKGTPQEHTISWMNWNTTATEQIILEIASRSSKSQQQQQSFQPSHHPSSCQGGW